MGRVPPEIVGEILERLDQDDLRRAAAVSRAFYASSWRAGLFIHRNIRWERGESCAAQLATFSEVLQHVLKKSLRLSLSLVFRASRYEGQTSGTPYTEVLSSVQIALHVLVALSVSARDTMIPIVADALRSPAPVMQSLSLGMHTASIAERPVLPVDFFNGSAPKLHSIVLHDICVPQTAIAAFAHIRSLDLKYTASWPDIVFARHFPALRCLSLSVGLVTSFSPAPEWVPYDLHGVRLERLTIDDPMATTLMPEILRGGDPIDVPVFIYKSHMLQWTEAFWHGTSTDVDRLSVRLISDTAAELDVKIIMVPEHRRWYREYIIDGRWPPSFPLEDLPQLGERLAYLRMDNIYLIGFLDCADVTFPALRDMHVDFAAEAAHSAMVWPPDWIHVFKASMFSYDEEERSAPTFETESYCYLDCPALETLRLFAVYREVGVASQEVAFLGRALSQCLRPKQDRAALELHGITFKDHVAHGLLDETFSAVRHYAFTDWNGPVGRDSGLWDNC